MNYSAMIQNRRSVHAFREKEVPSEAIGQLRSYYEKTCPRLVPEIATELIVLDKDAQPALESSAGYKQFLIGAPHYLLLICPAFLCGHQRQLHDGRSRPQAD